MSDLAQSAVDLIAKFGRTAVLRVSTRVAGESDKPWGSATDTVTTSDTKVTVVFQPSTQEDMQNRVSSVGRLVTDPIAKNGSTVLLAAKGLKVLPTIDMTLVDGDDEYEILSVVKSHPGRTAYLYTLEVQN